MLSLDLFAVLTACLVHVLVDGGAERRTCVRKFQYMEREHYGWLLLKLKYVQKTRDALFCCDGYNPVFNQTSHFVEVSSDAECIPFCIEKCPADSTCQPPVTCECLAIPQFGGQHHANRCTCNEGYMRTKEGKCIPFCPDHCVNGICNNLTCTCKEGFRVNNLKMCIPECKGGCEENEECTSPGKCSLKACTKPGYERNEINKCVPKCQNGCMDGKCTSPGNCTCNEGYQLNAVTLKCEAKCDNCMNGFCMSPQKCECNVGFKYVAGECVKMSVAELSTGEMDFWLWIGLLVVLVLLGAVITLGCYYGWLKSRNNDMTARLLQADAEENPNCTMDVNSYPAKQGVSNKTFEQPLNETVGDASTVVIGQGALPLAKLDAVSYFKTRNFPRTTQDDRPKYLQAI